MLSGMRVRQETARQRDRRERLRRAVERSGLTETEVARRLGLARQNVGYWLTGANWMRAATLDRLAEVLGAKVPGVTAIWIEHGPGLDPPKASRAAATAAESARMRVEVPVIDWHTVTLWHPGSARALGREAHETVQTARRMGEDAFALRVMDDSMAPLVPLGATVIADPALGAPDSGDYVVVTLAGDDRAILRRYRHRRDGAKVLVPANDAYPEIGVGDDDVFAGVVRVIQPPEVVLK